MNREIDTLHEQISELVKDNGVSLKDLSFHFIEPPQEGLPPLVVVDVADPSLSAADFRNLSHQIRNFLGSAYFLEVGRDHGERNIEDLLSCYYPGSSPKSEAIHQRLSSYSLRHWASVHAPEGVVISSLDFHDISGKVSINGNGKTKRQTQSVAVMRASVPDHRRSEFTAFSAEFEKHWGTPLLLSPIPFLCHPLRILREDLETSAPGIISREDIPALKEFLSTRLRWMTPRQNGGAVNMSGGNWFSIDSPHTILREDLIWIERDGSRFVVHVAQPDITRRHSLNNNMRPAEGLLPSKQEAVFCTNQAAEAWVVDLIFEGAGLLERSDPYRAVVRNKCEFYYDDRSLANVDGIADLMTILAVSSEAEMIDALMVNTQEAIGDFLLRNNVPFLARRSPDAIDGKASILQSLNETGIPATGEDLDSELRIAALAQAARDLRAYASLPPLMSALIGEPVILAKEHGRCAIKAQRGTPEQLNQLVLASVVDHRPEALPDFIQDLLDTGASSSDALGRELLQYETERHVAKVVNMLIGTLSRQGRELRVRVLHRNKGELLCESSDLRRWGFLAEERFPLSTWLSVQLGPFHLEKGRFEFLNPSRI